MSTLRRTSSSSGQHVSRPVRAALPGRGLEVKDLARETARATDDIGRRVESVQAGTAAAVGVVDDISLVIGRISDSASTIAAAVEEQTATTGAADSQLATTDLARMATELQALVGPFRY